MIRVIEGHKVKDSAAIQPVLLHLRANAMQYPGYVGGEFLLGEKDSSIVVAISTWVTTEGWKLWENSRIRADLYRQAKTLLLEEPQISIYMIVPTQW
jgi:heme-degrading monooxygenase HmoA